jgi:hypothetical protein
MRSPTHRTHLGLAGLLVILLLAVSATPSSAATVRRMHGAEDLAVRLVNCLRTGGKVTVGGRCKGWGSGRFSARRPTLKRSRRISNNVSWPWARRTVSLYSARTCWVGHTLAGSTLDKRFRSAGLRHQANGENIGCASYKPRRMVIFIVRLWQREKAYRGSHWRQIKDTRFRSMGVAVARRGSGKSQLVVNFYGKANP